MSFINSFHKTAEVLANDEISRADVTLPEKETGTARRTLQLPRGQRQQNKGSGQSRSGVAMSQFGTDKEIDPDRFPAKNWLNSRIPGV